MENESRLSSVLNLERADISINRSLLSERAADTIRSHISSGRLPEGTKVTEDEVSNLLGISRAPARDALKILETEGLLIARARGRFVRTLTEKDVRELHELRSSLEMLAFTLAAQRATQADRQLMATRMKELEEVAAGGDPNEWARCDLALHRSIWQAAGNGHLLKTLDSVIGSVFILVYRVSLKRQRNVPSSLRAHRKLVKLVATGKAEEASAEIEDHMMRSLEACLRSFQFTEKEAGTPG
ncbi:MAG: FCD domain-containing protein [Candidatus Latescibacteria bacterium]|nr:FCD domain-containing protein [Candidatus Latescibacterota bacterium]